MQIFPFFFSKIFYQHSTTSLQTPGLDASNEELEHCSENTVYDYIAMRMKICYIHVLLQWILILASQNPSQMVTTGGKKQHRIDLT